MPPTESPLPRFVAEPPHDLEPYGRWAELLAERFAGVCNSIEGIDADVRSDEIAWFPERRYGGRTYAPASAPSGSGEVFGYVSFVRDASSGEPGAFEERADWTEEIAELHPEWKLDLNEEVVDSWRGVGKAEGNLTLVWGTPLVRGGAAVTAELGAETLDQCVIGHSGRFTLLAIDAVTGLSGDELYLDVCLWNKRGQLLATESLYV